MFKGYEYGAVDVLLKPINPEILRQKADVFFELHRQRQQLSAAVRAREDVLAIVSHDMRTPLYAAAGLLLAMTAVTATMTSNRRVETALRNAATTP